MKNLKSIISTIFLLVLLVGQNLATDFKVLTCDAFFTYEAYDGPSPVTGGITFQNESSGTFENISWDFGDGNFTLNPPSDTLDHFYASEGLYSVCVTIWDDLGCTSTFCSDVIVGNLSNICNLTDCVFPGDANQDGEANFYDLLDLGVGNGVTGPVRPNATIEWIGQLAPDWAQTTSDGVNYKHLDCDGNGIIDEADAQAISANYFTMNAPNPTSEASAPLIDIEFAEDTIYVDVNSSIETYVIKANLKVGNSQFPASNIYGLALYLSYPGDLVSEDSVSFEYYNNSFFGAPNEVLWVPNDQYANEQIDIGLTRLDGSSVSGSGIIGEGEFIIEADILDGRVINGDVHFPISINGVKMIDEDGNELPINLPNTPPTVVFTNLIADGPTSTDDLELAHKIKIFPNPAVENVTIDLTDLNGEQLEIFNNFGQRILQQDIYKSKIELNTKAWNAGIYFVKIQTQEGVVSKRFVKK